MAAAEWWQRPWARACASPCLTVTLLALGVRLALGGLAGWHDERFYVSPDSYEYDQIAVNLVQGRGYSRATAEPYVPDVRRTPVYPVLLAGLYAVLGHQPGAAVVVNALLGTLGAALTAALGRRLFGASVGLLAGLIVATDLTSVVYSLTLMTEPLFTVLLLCSTLAAVRFLADGGHRPLALAALCWAIGILTRPIALFLPLLLGPLLAWLAPGGRWAGRLLLGGALAVAALALPAAWTLRNYQVAGVAQLTSLVAINSYYHRAALMEATRRGVSVAEVRDEFAAALDTQQDLTPDADPTFVAEMERRAARIIFADPLGYAELHLRGLVHLLGPDRQMLARLTASPLVTAKGAESDEEPAAPGATPRRYNNAQTVALGALQLLVVYVLAVGGVAVGLRWPDSRRATLLIVTIVLYFLVMSGPEAYARFRVPVMPYVALLAALGAGTCGARLRALRRSPPGVAPRHEECRLGRTATGASHRL